MPVIHRSEDRGAHEGHEFSYSTNGLYCETCDEYLAAKFNVAEGRYE